MATRAIFEIMNKLHYDTIQTTTRSILTEHQLMAVSINNAYSLSFTIELSRPNCGRVFQPQ